MIDTGFDYHAHILPGCDHGSDGLETSVKQVASARAAGVHTVCATPHFYPHKESLDAFLQRRRNAFEQLSPRLSPEDPRVLLGAEVLICEGLERMPGLESLCLEGTNELLLELPFYKWPSGIRNSLMLLCEMRDVRVIIAHAERYPQDDIEMLISEGVPLQLNISALASPKSKRRCLPWIERGCVPYIGSDIHMLDPAYRDWEKASKLIRKYCK